MAIKDVIVVSVPVSDPDRARAFYVEKLGFELQRDDTSIPGMHWIQLAPRGSTASLTLVTWFETMPPGSLRGLVLSSDSIQAGLVSTLSVSMARERVSAMEKTCHAQPAPR